MDIRLWLISTLAVCVVSPVAHSEDVLPVYNEHYIQDNCDEERVIDLRDESISLYGYIHATRSSAYRSGVCSIALRAASDRKIVVRFSRIEIYKDSSQCDDVLEISGNSSSLEFCGTGTPPYAVISTGNFLRFEFRASEQGMANNLRGFQLYYTAFHTGVCHTSSGEEFRCHRDYRCIPGELTCDNLDNCGDWSDEGVSACGLSTGAIIALSIVCILVGGTIIGFVVYYFMTKRKERNRRRQRNNGINPTMNVSHDVANGETTINISSERTSINVNGREAGGNRRYAEPPPPYTYTNAGLYSAAADESVERDPDAPPAYDSNDHQTETPSSLTVVETDTGISISSSPPGASSSVSRNQTGPATSVSTERPKNTAANSSNQSETANSNTANQSETTEQL